MTYLFVCSIGPVQDFIATARTSHDLWFGSWLLSELSKAAAMALNEHHAELVFPNPSNARELDPGTDLNVANKMVALASNDPKTLAGETKLAVFQRLHDLVQPPLNLLGEQARTLACQQLDDLIEFYWASADMPDRDQYQQAREMAESVLSARKNIRNFGPWPGVAGIPKSSLDGFRENVYVSDKEDERTSKGETLSGVDWVKRFGTRQGKRYWSTSDFAALPFRKGLGDLGAIILSELKSLLTQYTSETETDGAYYYEDRLIRFVDEEEQDEFRKAYNEIFRNHDIHQRPSPYYALLLADGDSMGKTIDHQELADKHRALSRALSQFAEKAKGIIKGHEGQAVYVGGDDILAYLPLHTALDCVAELDDTFTEVMKRFSYEDSGVQRQPTLSGGLVVAHHLTPLSDVLDAARRAEKRAKNHRPQKHALAVAINKRGGGETIAVETTRQLLERMKILVEFTRKGALSKGAAYDLRELAALLRGTGLESEAFEKEAVRIIKRKRESGGGKDVGKEVQEELHTWLKGSNGQEEISVDELANEMIVAAEFAKAVDLANHTIRKEATA